MKRPIRAVNAWNVFVEGDDNDITVVYRMRWVPAIGGAIKICNGVAKDWHHLPLEKFSKKYFRFRLAGRPQDRTRRTS